MNTCFCSAKTQLHRKRIYTKISLQKEKIAHLTVSMSDSTSVYYIAAAVLILVGCWLICKRAARLPIGGVPEVNPPINAPNVQPIPADGANLDQGLLSRCVDSLKIALGSVPPWGWFLLLILLVLFFLWYKMLMARSAEAQNAQNAQNAPRALADDANTS